MSALSAKRRVVLGPESDGMGLTPEEFDAVEDYDEGYEYELIHGVVVVNPIPLEAEAGPNEFLGYLLLHYRESHPQGRTLDATLPERYIRTKDSRRKADRIIYAGLGRMPKWKREVPTIAVDFTSKHRGDQRRDYIEKKQEYMDLGMAEYWIIDRFQRRLTVIRNNPSGVEELVFAEQEIYKPALLPGFELPLARVLSVADAMAQAEQD